MAPHHRSPSPLLHFEHQFQDLEVPIRRGSYRFAGKRVYDLEGGESLVSGEDVSGGLVGTSAEKLRWHDGGTSKFNMREDLLRRQLAGFERLVDIKGPEKF